MKKLGIGNHAFQASEIALGCMRMASLAPKEAENLIKTALDEGINFFDHADIYGAGRSEEIFAQAARLSEDGREKVIIQTKCGISKNYFSGDVVSRSDAREVAAAWAPYCSVATWYIWRSLDPLPVDY